MPTAKEIYQMILNLRGPDEQERTKAIHNLSEISTALGLRRTIDELIPYVMETATFTETQWIDALNQLGTISLEGATPKQYLRTVKNVALACDMDSRGIRAAAVKTVTKMIRDSPSGKTTGILKAVFSFMVETESPALIASALTIMGNVIDLLDFSAQAEMFSAYAKLESNDTVMVRVAWITAASDIVKHMKGSYIPKLLGAMNEFAGDSCCPAGCAIPKFMQVFVEKHGQVDEIMVLGQKLLEHPNWRVRCEYVRNIENIYSKETVDFGGIFKILSAAVEDAEDEVKTAAAEELPFLSTLSGINGNDVTSLLTQFFEAKCPHVKTSAVKSLHLFINHITSEFLGTHLPKMAKDESQEVKITAIEALKSKNIPVDMKIMCIKEAAASPEWREKESVSKLIPLIFVEEEATGFIEVIMRLLFDDAHDVRKAMLKNLANVMFSVGDKFREQLLEAFEKEIESDDYQIRQTVTNAVVQCRMESTSSGTNIITKAARDAVANVRLVAAKVIPRTSAFASLLEELKADKDDDVREAAQM